MASTARNIKLDTANTNRKRSVTLPISSAGMHPPGPHPGPARAAEECAHGSEANCDSNEPGHNPPGERFRPQRVQPAFFRLPAGVGENQKCGDQRGRRENRPGVERGEKGEQQKDND